jgi:hypothetical protein
MKVTEVIPFVTERYPWTHRIRFEDPAHQYPVCKWTEELDIPGIWVSGAFYTTAKYVTIISLKWSHL